MSLEQARERRGGEKADRRGTGRSTEALQSPPWRRLRAANREHEVARSASQSAEAGRRPAARRSQRRTRCKALQAAQHAWGRSVARTEQEAQQREPQPRCRHACGGRGGQVERVQRKSSANQSVRWEREGFVYLSKNKRGGQDITIAARPDKRTKTTTQFDTLLPSPVAFIGAQKRSPPPPAKVKVINLKSD